MKENYWNKYLNLPPALHTDTMFKNSLKAMGTKIAERVRNGEDDYAYIDKNENLVLNSRLFMDVYNSIYDQIDKAIDNLACDIIIELSTLPNTTIDARLANILRENGIIDKDNNVLVLTPEDKLL
jgi:hypothetical protein